VYFVGNIGRVVKASAKKAKDFLNAFYNGGGTDKVSLKSLLHIDDF